MDQEWKDAITLHHPDLPNIFLVKTQTRYEESAGYFKEHFPHREEDYKRYVRNSRQIANRALETDALIVLGEIKHLRRRKQNTRGRKFNRKLSGFRYYKLRQYKIYKAALVGIKVIQVSEASTCNIAENAIR